MGFLADLAKAVLGALATSNRQSGGATTATSTTPRQQTSSSKKKTRKQPQAAASYPGDYHGQINPEYSPNADGDPDPGEVVWTWVPYEEDYTQGKDRPVLLVGRDGAYLLALQLTSKDHDRDANQEAREGRYWMDVGSGPWDSKGRPSEIRLNRVLRIDPSAVRREGSIMDKQLFTKVIQAAQACL